MIPIFSVSEWMYVVYMRPGFQLWSLNTFCLSFVLYSACFDGHLIGALVFADLVDRRCVLDVTIKIRLLVSLGFMCPMTMRSGLICFGRSTHFYDIMLGSFSGDWQISDANNLDVKPFQNYWQV